MSDTHDVKYEEYEESWTGRIIVAAVIAVALIAGSFFVGRVLASGGPATLADAVEQAQAGDLPCGEAATPAATPAAGAGGEGGQGGRPGGAGFALRAICQPDGQQQAGGSNGGPGRGRGGLGQTGTVTALDGDTLTLEGPMGSTTVQLDGATTINKSSAGDRADIKPGESVIVSGAGGPNAGGPATSVTILPAAGGN